MSAPTDQELRELDVWIASYIFMFYVHREGKVLYISTFQKPDWNNKSGLLPEYTTDPAVAMLVLEMCAVQYGELPRIRHDRTHWVWANPKTRDEPYHVSDSLCIAICQFAKALFSK